MDGLAAWTRHDADLSDKECGANEGDGAYEQSAEAPHPRTP